MRTTCRLVAALAAGLALAPGARAQDLDKVIRDLNQTRSVSGTDEVKSYRTVFDAYLQCDPLPFPISDRFNLATIHPGMDDWPVVSSWAESNPQLAEALIATQDYTLFGLPYGSMNVPSEYREAGLYVNIGDAGTLQDIAFPYLDALSVIAAYATAESYRLCEAGDTTAGLDLSMASIFFERQCCDREFIQEVIYGIDLLNGGLSNMRDLMWTYRDRIDAVKLEEIAKDRLPFVRTDRGRLFMPEGDRVVAEALITEVFDTGGQPDREKFAETFAGIQSKEAPLTRFGAGRRWRLIADVHDSLESSLMRLKLVYDDWWRRWRVQEYDPILDVPTQFERTNPIRYAAVIFSMEDITDLMAARNLLIANHHGTEMAAGICAYYRTLGAFPAELAMTYSQTVRKRSDTDPFDRDFGPFRYRRVTARKAINTPQGRVWAPAGMGVLYSRGTNNEDDYDATDGWEHSMDAQGGDLVVWPPVRSLQREAGLIR